MSHPPLSKGGGEAGGIYLPHPPMKKLLLLVLFSSLVLAGCATQNTAIETKETMTADQLFEKKKECIESHDTMMKQFGDKYSHHYSEFSIYEIFYSPKLNTCIYLTEALEIPPSDKALELIKTVGWNGYDPLNPTWHYWINDYFSKERLFSVTCKGSDQRPCNFEFDKRVTEFKWE